MKDAVETLQDLGLCQLRALAHALGVPAAAHPYLCAVFSDLAVDWGARARGLPPRWSGMTDDCSPYEFSIAFSRGATELRLVTEAQAGPASAASYWQAAARVSRTIEARWGGSLERLRAIEPLFEPQPQAFFAALHAAVLWPAARPLFKVYLNPAARGRPAARELVRAALDRLGEPALWSFLEARVPAHAEAHFLALDLEAGAAARIKVYFRLPPLAPAALEALVARIDPGLAPFVHDVSRAIYGTAPERYPRPVIVTYAFRNHASAGIACHFPCLAFAGTDAALAARLAGLFETHGLDARAYLRAVAALQPSDAPAYGVHDYVSLQRGAQGPRLTVYLGPRVYLERYGALALDPPRVWPSPVVE